MQICRRDTHIVINVLSSDGSLSESTTGTYVLNPTGKAWVKIANSDVKLGDIQIHDCVVSTTGQKQLVEDLCSRQ
jgi:hypothetical protein